MFLIITTVSTTVMTLRTFIVKRTLSTKRNRKKREWERRGVNTINSFQNISLLRKFASIFKLDSYKNFRRKTLLLIVCFVSFFFLNRNNFLKNRERILHNEKKSMARPKFQGVGILRF